MRKILLLITALPCLAMGANFTKTPSLYLTGKPDEMKVVWQADAAPTGTVSLSWQPGGSSESADGRSVIVAPCLPEDWLYEHLITGLVTSTFYSYSVTMDGHTVRGAFRSPPPDEATNVSFYAFGDTRSNPGAFINVMKALQKDMQGHPERHTFIIQSGDLVAQGDRENLWNSDWFISQSDQITIRAGMPVMGAPGNHDSGPLYRKYLRMDFPDQKATYNAFNYGPIRVISLDQNAWLRAGDRQYNWLTNELAIHTNRHLVFCFHSPGWSAGSHANNRAVQRLLQPLFERHGVRLAVCGHNHNYAHAETGGVHHITTGGGGAPLAPINMDRPCVVAAEMSHHFVRIDIDGDVGTVTAIRTNSTIIDTFTFNRAILDYPLPPMVIPHADPTPSMSVPYVARRWGRGRPSGFKWSKAIGVPIDRDIWGDAYTNREAVAQFAHDGEHLYLRFREKGDYRKLRNNGYGGDRWEFFFAPAQAEPYRQLSVMPDGQLNLHDFGEEEKLAAWQDAVKLDMDTRNHEYWDIKLVIPFTAIMDGGVKPGQTIYVNIFRAASENESTTAWSPVFGDSYHDLTRLGQVLLAPKR